MAPPRILAIANQKGGVGKTTTAINLATALAAVGEKILLIDLDPQGNASTGLGIPRTDRAIGSYRLIADDAPLADTIRETAIPNLSLMTAEADLAGAEIELVALSRREFRLRDALSALRDGTSPYNFVLIDCPPSLGLLTLNGLVAADAVLVPLQCEFFALEGLSQLFKTVERVRANLNPRLEIQGVVLTMFDRRNSLSEQVAQDVRSVLGEKVYQTVIPRNVRISEAPSHGKPVLLYDHACTGSQAYIRLASEIIRRERELRAA
jgi:chromosome partitioning protein